MRIWRHALVAVPCIALSLGVPAPLYASSIVFGAVFANPSTIFHTGDQAGSPLSNILAPWSFTCSTCSGFGVSGSGAASVINGALGVTSTVTVTGATPPSSVGADSIANYTDVLTITGGTGTGVLELAYAVDGAIIGTGISPGGLALFILGPTGGYVQKNGGAIQLNNGTALIGAGPHADIVNFYIPFTYGTPFSIQPQMISNATFNSSEATPYTSTVDFYGTATLSSALVFGGTPLSLGLLNSAADIGSTTGFTYGPTGIPSPVPEPGTWLLLVSGIGAWGLLNRRRRRA